MNNQIYSLWQESFKLVSQLHAHASTFPKKDVIGLRAQLEHIGMEFMNQIAEVSTASTLREVRKKLAESIVTLSRVSGILSMAKITFSMDDLKLQMGITLVQTLISQIQDTILAAPARMSA
ncbi:hypothetical protein EP331_12970 [bacterium]|nr:MAG: hypothetical protein EP331_12970 [bacterium]